MSGLSDSEIRAMARVVYNGVRRFLQYDPELVQDTIRSVLKRELEKHSLRKDIKHRGRPKGSH